MIRPVVLALAALAAGSAAAQTPGPIDVSKPLPFAEGFPKRVPTPGGEVIIASGGEHRAYDELKFAPARRVGDTIYVSGVIAGTTDAGGAEAFEQSLRLAFRRLERTLKADGASFADVVMINSFHVWDSPRLPGGRDAHFRSVARVKDEFMPAPHPAWTAVGTTGLLAPDGLVEIQLIAHAPKR